MTDDAQNAKPTAALIKDGPLKVSGLTAVYDAQGGEIECKETVFFCRCGASNNKPFCDGSHKASGFQHG